MPLKKLDAMAAITSIKSLEAWENYHLVAFSRSMDVNACKYTLPKFMVNYQPLEDLINSMALLN